MAITPEVKAAVDNLLNDWDASGGKGGAQRVLRDFSSAADSVPANTSGATDEQRLGYALDVLKAFKEGGWAFSTKGYQGYMGKVVPLVQAYAPAQNIFPLWKSTSEMETEVLGGGGEDSYVIRQPAGVNYGQWDSSGVARQLGYAGPIYGVVGQDSEGGGITGFDPQFTSFVDQKRAEGYDFVQYQPDLRNYRQKYGFRLPGGQVVGEHYGEGRDADVTSFFKNFLLPAAGIAFGMGGLNSLMGGAAAAPANALAGIAEGMIPGGLTAAGIPATAAELSAVGALTGAASAPIFDLGGNVINPVTSEILSPASTTPGTLPPLTPLTPGAGAKPGLTGIPALDKAIDLVTSPAGQAVVGAVGSAAGGVMQANAAEAAANQQAEAARNALQLQRDMFDYQKELLDPYRKRGEAALTRLSGALGLEGPAQAQQMLEMDPGYGFRLGEGLKALERMQAARGNMLSGGALKAGTEYAQKFASNEYDRAFGRLADIAGIGRSTAAQQGTAAQQFGTSAGNVMGQEANALAAGRYGRTSAYTDALGGVLGAYENYLNRGQRNQLARDIYGRMLGGGS